MHIAAEYERRKYLKRKRLGLCVKCGRKVGGGKLHCVDCLSKARERRRALHPVVCAECKKQISSKLRLKGKRLHPQCAQKRQARRYPGQHRAAALAYQRRHRDMGLCFKCPQKVFRTRFCRKHYRMVKERVDRAAVRS